MKTLVFFDLNRLSYEGGAENYISEVSRELNKNSQLKIIYLGDFRFLVKFYVLLGFILTHRDPKQLKKDWLILKSVQGPRPDTAKNIIYRQIKFKDFLPLSKSRLEIKRIFKLADLILVKNEWPELIFARLLNLPQTKTAVLVFTSLFYPLAGSLRSKLHNWFYNNSLYKKFLLKARYLIVSNKNDYSGLMEQFGLKPDRLKYIPYGLPEDFFVSNYQPDPRFRLLFAGRLEEQKGVKLLPAIIKKLGLTSYFNNLEIHIAGTGPDLPIIKRLTEQYQNVKYLGLVLKNQMPNLYDRADIFIMPSLWETFGYTCLEAQARGVPVVAFDIPGPQDIVINGQTGFLVEKFFVDSFATAINKIYLKTRQAKFLIADWRLSIIKQTSRFSLSRTINSLLKLVD